jgi:hypothetical protein
MSVPGSETLLPTKSVWAKFLLAGLAIYSLIYFLGRTTRATLHAQVFTYAALFDLTVSVGAAFYILVLRNELGSWLTLVAVAMTGLRAAPWLFPAVERQYLPATKWIAVPFELLLVVILVRRYRSLPDQEDALSRLRIAASVLPNQTVARLLAAEASVLYYALFSWRAKPDQGRTGLRAFSCAQTSGYSFLGTILCVLILAEAAPIHLLLAHYSRIAAWFFTAADAYALVWAVALIRSVKLRPILLDLDTLKIRAGMVWDVAIPRDLIVSCSRPPASVVSEKKTPGYLRAVVLDAPRYVIELRQPVLATGIYGQRRVVSRIGISVDNPEAFLAAMVDNGRENG